MLWADPRRDRTPSRPAASESQSRWLDRGLIAASLLILTTGYRVVVEGTDWWITTLLVTLVAMLTCAVLRALGVRLVAPVAAVVLFVTVAWVFVPHTLSAGLPTPGSISALSDLVGDARVVIVQEQAPVAAARGIVLLLAAAFGALVVVADALLELPRRAAWIGLLLLLAGVSLMLPSGLEWLRTGRITHHWSYFAAGGTSILTGLQLSTWCVLLAMADDLTSRPDRARRDLRTP